MTESIYNHYISRIPRIVEAKLRDFDHSNLCRPAIPTLSFAAKDFFSLPEEKRNNIINQYRQALKKVGITCMPITDRKIFGVGWYLYKDE
jgi:hypothetical protein